LNPTAEASRGDVRDDRIAVGLLAAHDDRELAEVLAADLPEALRERGVGGDVEWCVEIAEADPADASASASELVDAVRQRLLDHDWRMGIGLTVLPLRSRRRPVAAHASASHGVGLVSVPALGALHRDARLRETTLGIVEGLLGEAAADRGGGDGSGRAGRMTRRSLELASPAGRERAQDDGTLRFTTHVAGGNLRLLVGMIRANHPTRVMARLSRASTAALGTGAYALSSSSLWTLSDRSSWPRLLAVGLLALGVILVSMVIAHDLWEHARDEGARERVVLFNIVTVTTLAIGVATLYLALFVMMTLAGAVIIPPASLAKEIGHGASLNDYLRLGWFVASVATVGGAFGSLVESDEAVREAAYRSHVGGRPGQAVSESQEDVDATTAR
jgi:hypothetical protein